MNQNNQNLSIVRNETPFGEFHIVLYGGNGPRPYAWICKRTIRPNRSAITVEDIHKRSYGIRTPEKCKEKALRHILDYHGGGIIWNSFELRKGVWMKIKISIEEAK